MVNGSLKPPAEFAPPYEVDPLFIVYSEILWLGGAVLVLTAGALVGLLSREYPTEQKSSKPLVLSTEQRALLLAEKHSSITKALETRKAAKKAVKARHKEIAAGRREEAKTDVNG